MIQNLRARLKAAKTRANIPALSREVDGVFDFALESSGVAAENSHAQRKQDVAALLATNFKSSGFFVEFGATNGVDLSNTFLLEKKFNWTGILAEPEPYWHDQLRQNRGCIIDDRCVWHETGKRLEFSHAENREYSTIAEYQGKDLHGPHRNSASSSLVSTVSLKDLLDEHKAPEVVDYLSIDTEGSEADILQAFDFKRRKFRFITVEHNYSDNRERIHDILTRAGYRRLFRYLSRFDDWYVPAHGV